MSIRPAGFGCDSIGQLPVARAEISSFAGHSPTLLRLQLMHLYFGIDGRLQLRAHLFDDEFHLQAGDTLYSTLTFNCMIVQHMLNMAMPNTMK